MIDRTVVFTWMKLLFNWLFIEFAKGSVTTFACLVITTCLAGTIVKVVFD